MGEHGGIRGIWGGSSLSPLSPQTCRHHHCHRRVTPPAPRQSTRSLITLPVVVSPAHWGLRRVSPANPNLVPSPADEVVPYKAPCMPRGHVSGSCSTTGSVSSRGSTSSRGHGSGRSRTRGDRGEGTSHRHRPPCPCPGQEKR